MIWERNGGNITFISKRGKPMYEKDGSSQILVQSPIFYMKEQYF